MTNLTDAVLKAINEAKQAEASAAPATQQETPATSAAQAAPATKTNTQQGEVKMNKFKLVPFTVEDYNIEHSKGIYTANKAFVAATSFQTGVLTVANGKFRRFELEAPVQEFGSSRVNALAGIINVLESGKVEESGDAGVYLIFSNGAVVDAINKGAYRNYLATGKFKNGKPVSETELNLWARFVGALSANFHRVEFRNIASAAVVYKEEGQKKPRLGTVKEVLADNLPVYRKNNHLMQVKAWEVVAATVGVTASTKKETALVEEEMFTEEA